MNHLPRHTLRLGQLAATALLLVTICPAQVPIGVSPDPTLLGRASSREKRTTLRIITDAPAGPQLSHFVRRAAHDRAGHPLGTVKDVYIDAHSGKGVFLGVQSPSDNAVRLVPFGAIGKSSPGGALTLPIARKEWEQITPASVPDPDATRITLSATDLRQLDEKFGLPVQRSDTGAHLVAVTEVRGKRVTTGSDNIGTIDAIILQPEDATVAVVITPEKDFSVAGRKFVMSAQQLNLGARDLNPITTSLTRTDFERARQRESDLTPTGRPADPPQK